MKFFDEMLKVINNLDNKKSLPEENVLLHIRARGLIKTSRLGILRVVLLGFPLNKLIDVLSLPITIYKKLKSLIISLCITILCYLVLNLDLIELTIIFVIALILSNLKSFSNWFQCFTFDIFDILLFSSLTKLWLKIYFSKTNSHQDWLNKFNSPLNLHIYTSRQLWNDKTIQSEEDEFGRVIQDNINDRKKISLLVKEYWSKH